MIGRTITKNTIALLLEWSDSLNFEPFYVRFAETEKFDKIVFIDISGEEGFYWFFSSHFFGDNFEFLWHIEFFLIGL